MPGRVGARGPYAMAVLACTTGPAALARPPSRSPRATGPSCSAPSGLVFCHPYLVRCTRSTLLARVARLGEREEDTVRTTGRRIAGAVLVVFVVVLVPRSARALELNGGVSLGGFLAGNVPRLAVSPHAGLSWRMESGLLFAVHDLFSVLPMSNRGGIGVYNQTSMAIGYASKDANFSAGPSFGIYSMVACSATLCGRVAGLSPGGQAQANAFFAGRLGVSVSGYVNWMGGSSLVLPGGVAAMVVAGPVFRWDSREPQ